MEVFEAQLVDAVRTTAPGRPSRRRFRAFVLERSGRLGDDGVADVVATSARTIRGSRALQARKRELVAG